MPKWVQQERKCSRMLRDAVTDRMLCVHLLLCVVFGRFAELRDPRLLYYIQLRRRATLSW